MYVCGCNDIDQCYIPRIPIRDLLHLLTYDQLLIVTIYILYIFSQFMSHQEKLVVNGLGNTHDTAEIKEETKKKREEK